MADEAKQEGARRSRRGTEQRQKQRIINFRVTPEEDAELTASAASAGLTPGTYARMRALTAPKTRSRIRRPPVEVQALTRLQGEMNKVGSNIHQILKRVN